MTSFFQAIFPSGRRLNLWGDSLAEAHADFTHVCQTANYRVDDLKMTTTGGSCRIWHAGNTDRVRIELIG